MLRNVLLFNEAGVQVAALGERVLDGSKLAGLRIRGDVKDGIAETTLWFASDGSLKRAQMRKRFEQDIINIQTRAISQKRDETLPPDTFQAPPPFKSDVFEPRSTELLSRAARFYGGFVSSSGELPVTQAPLPDEPQARSAEAAVEMLRRALERA